MREILIVVSALLAGAFAWFPFMIGIAAHRYELGGAQIKSHSRWIQLSTRAPKSFSILGRIAFILVMLIWLFLFFGAFAVPSLLAKALGVPETSPSIGYTIYANMLAAAIAFCAGPAIWRRLAL